MVEDMEQEEIDALEEEQKFIDSQFMGDDDEQFPIDEFGGIF